MRLDIEFPLRDLVGLVLAKHGATSWELVEDGFWCRVVPPSSTDRLQGWKLHLSATPLSAPEVLYRAAEVLVSQGCLFKFAARATNVEELTSGRFDRAQSGKFITAYPHDDIEFQKLAETLDRVTAGLPGPAILSDRPYRQGGLVHYRYGAFNGVRVLTSDGVWEARLTHPSGSLVADVRRPWFSPPEWAELPFPGPPAPGAGNGTSVRREPVLLNGRYLVKDAIRHSARGGVYRATDQRDDRPVVIKQARAYIGGGMTSRDARDALREEAAALAALAGLAPRLIEVFDRGDHTFLVEEMVPGTTLAEWVQQRAVESATGHCLPVDTALAMATRLANLLGEVHRRGLVYRDFNPNNVMVTPDEELLLIDPELAVPPGRPTVRSYTPGFAAPECVSAESYGPAPEPAADWFSLGATLLYLVTGASVAGAADDSPPYGCRPVRPSARAGGPA